MPIKQPMTPEDARRDHRQMLRFMALNAAIGVFLGLMVAALLIVLDIGGIGTRILHAENPVLPILLIAVPLASVFGGSVAASAIWLMPYERKFAPDRRKEENDQ
jgi:hypothetical protein